MRMRSIRATRNWTAPRPTAILLSYSASATHNKWYIAFNKPRLVCYCYWHSTHQIFLNLFHRVCVVYYFSCTFNIGNGFRLRFSMLNVFESRSICCWSYWSWQWWTNISSGFSENLIWLQCYVEQIPISHNTVTSSVNNI